MVRADGERRGHRAGGPQQPHRRHGEHRASTLLGLTAFALARHRFRGKRRLEGLLYIPIILPEIVMGISLLAFFALAGMRLGLATMIVAHITFCAAFVSVVVRARLHGLDPRWNGPPWT